MTKNSYSSGLSARQEAFAVAYARHHNASQAAREAGYAHGCASVTGTRLIANASVLERIRELEAQTAVDMGMSRERWLIQMEEAAALARERQDPMAMISAWREIGKACGFYKPERVHMKVDFAGDSELARLQSLPDSALLSMVAAARG